MPNRTDSYVDLNPHRSLSVVVLSLRAVYFFFDATVSNAISHDYLAVLSAIVSYVNMVIRVVGSVLSLRISPNEASLWR